MGGRLLTITSQKCCLYCEGSLFLLIFLSLSCAGSCCIDWVRAGCQLRGAAALLYNVFILLVLADMAGQHCRVIATTHHTHSLGGVHWGGAPYCWQLCDVSYWPGVRNFTLCFSVFLNKVYNIGCYLFTMITIKSCWNSLTLYPFYVKVSEIKHVIWIPIGQLRMPIAIA